MLFVDYLNILNGYKFTVEENTPLEEDVALDPELLGKVFENLLAAYNPETKTTARKQTGSFYTPREIVNYMVDESLIAYFESRLSSPSGREEGSLATNGEILRSSQDDNRKQKFRLLLSHTLEKPDFTEDETRTIINAIDNIKVLDPACGSGAFPMGVLHQLVNALSKLDPDNERWLAAQIERARNAVSDLTISERIEDVKKTFSANERDYARKLFLIQNCIYGVDIQPIAVQIAKLRFFISLVAEQKVNDTEPNRGIIPLPNLETNFVAANTLIGLDSGKSGTQPEYRSPEVMKLEEDLRNVRKQLFGVRKSREKNRLREDDKRLRTKLGKVLSDTSGMTAKDSECLANWDPYDQNASGDFFDPDWMFEVNGGFDIVIGNPPWVSLIGKHGISANINSKQLYLKHYEANTYMPNLYELFLQRGISLLSNDSHLCFIIPDRFGFNESYTSLRRKILTSTSIRQIIYKWDFENIIADTMTILIRNGRVSNNLSILIRNRPQEDFIPVDIEYVLAQKGHILKPYKNTKVKYLVEKIIHHSKTLGAICSTTSGFGGRSELITRERQNSKQIPILKGSSIQRYIVKQMFYFEFVNRNITGRTKDPIKLGVKEKILVRKTGDKIIAAYDTNGIYPEQSLYFLYNFKDKIPPKYILALLNSKLLTWFYQNALITNIDSTPQIKNYDLNNIPIILGVDYQKVIRLVNNILEMKVYNSEVNLDNIEDQIDQLVYEIYNLDENEIAIVEGRM